MTAVDELLAFIRRSLDARAAELDEDERVARAASPGPWRYDPTKHHREPGTVRFSEGVFTGPAGREATCVATTGESDDQQSMADAEHIARFASPTRVLERIEHDRRDIEAKRRILDEHDPTTMGACNTCCEYGMFGGENQAWPCRTIRLLAQPYAGQPGWQKEWDL